MVVVCFFAIDLETCRSEELTKAVAVSEDKLQELSRIFLERLSFPKNAQTLAGTALYHFTMPKKSGRTFPGVFWKTPPERNLGQPQPCQVF